MTLIQAIHTQRTALRVVESIGNIQLYASWGADQRKFLLIEKDDLIALKLKLSNEIDSLLLDL